MHSKLILTCEHGGNHVPKKYRALFEKNPAPLETHRGLDIGALKIAKHLQKKLKAPLDFSEVTRLLVDLNRTLKNSTLFSEFTASLSEAEKQTILNTYHTPHHQKIRQKVKTLTAQRKSVLHIGIHSFTPELNGNVRKMDLAVLYDPRRPSERKFANLWITEMRKRFPQYKFARNNPYKGSGDGLNSFFRKNYNDRQYAGLELEMNQKIVGNFKTESERKIFADALTASLQAALQKLKG